MSVAAHAQSTQTQSSNRQNAGGRVLQRKCACGRDAGPTGECAECRRKRMLQRKGTGPATPLQAAEPAGGISPAVESVLHSSGHPLDGGTRSRMEQRFGHDFGQVRIHTGAQAAASARAVQAQAFTVGHDIVFGERRYDPGSSDGLRLLAHELAHVVQQRDAMFPTGGLTVASDHWEREADRAAQAAVTGRPVRIRRRAQHAMIARFVESRTVNEPDGSEVQVERVLTAGRCRLVPERRTETGSGISARQAFLEVNMCRGRVSGGARGEVNYGDALTDAGRAAARLLTNLASGQRADQAVRTFENDLRQLTPNAQLRFNLRAPGFRLDLSGTGEASAAGGATGEGRLRLEFDVGPVTVGATGTVRGGTEEERSGQVVVTVEPRRRAEPSDCRICSCGPPQVDFRCTRRTPNRRTPAPPRPQPVIVPLFFEYADITPRPGWERRYQEMLQLAVSRIRGGYTITRIEGNASPEGPERQQPGGRFEGNIELANRRAQKAQADLQEALRRDLGSLMVMRGGENIRAALAASYPVEGRGELFGSTAAGEVPRGRLFAHLRSTLGAPQPGERDPLAEAHVIGDEALPESVRTETEAQVAEFRTGQRGERRLAESERAEAIYQPLRRALIFLAPPPPPPPPPVRTQLSREELRAVVGEAIPCTDAHRRLFAGVPLPPDRMFEGECNQPGQRPDRPRP